MKKIIIITLLFLQVSYGQSVKLDFENYTTIFSLELKQPLYTHYTLKYSDLKEKIKRKDFRKCPLIPQSSQANKSDYKKDTVYDIGHLSPFLDLNQSTRTILETSYYTNTAPQHYKLNRGVWRQIELFTHELCKKNKYNMEVYTLVTYGENKIGTLKIPTFFYKLIIIENKYFAFRFQNTTPVNSNYFYYKIDEMEVIKLIESYKFEKIIKQ